MLFFWQRLFVKKIPNTIFWRVSLCSVVWKLMGSIYIVVFYASVHERSKIWSMMNYLVFFCYHLSILGGTASSRPYFNNKNLEYRESILAHSSLRCSLDTLLKSRERLINIGGIRSTPSSHDNIYPKFHIFYYNHFPHPFHRLSPVLPYLDRESSQSKWQEKSVFGKGVLL